MNYLALFLWFNILGLLAPEVAILILESNNEQSKINTVYNIKPFLLLKYYSVCISSLNFMGINILYAVLCRWHDRECTCKCVYRSHYTCFGLWILFVLCLASGIRRPPNFYILFHHKFLDFYESICNTWTCYAHDASQG